MGIVLCLIGIVLCLIGWDGGMSYVSWACVRINSGPFCIRPVMWVCVMGEGGVCSCSISLYVREQSCACQSCMSVMNTCVFVFVFYHEYICTGQSCVVSEGIGCSCSISTYV